METTQNLEGLENFGSSQPVSDISDFLSLDQLGIVENISPDNVDLGEVEKPKVEEQEDIIVPLDNPQNPGKEDVSLDLSGEIVDVDLGENENEPVQSPSVDYKSMVEELVSNGVWEEIGAFETENGEVKFEDMDIDKETFVALMKHNQEEMKLKLTESTVSTQGISEFTQKLISIEKHGGNVQQAIKAFQTIKEPLNNLDVSDEKGQKAICFLRLQQQGIQGEEAKDLIETYERKGVLEAKATGFKEQLDEAFDSWMETQEKAAIDEDKAYRDSLKVYKSSLNDSLKNASEFGLSETHRRKLLDIATKEQEDGSFELDVLIDNHRRNPVDAADLILFLTDKNAFIEKKSKTLLDEERKKTLKTISIIPKGKSNLADLKPKDRGRDIIMPLDKL